MTVTAGVDSQPVWTTSDRSVTFTDRSTTFGLSGKPLEFLAGSRLSFNERAGQRVPVEDLGDLTVALFNNLAAMNDHKAISRIIVGQHSITLEAGSELPGVPQYMWRLLSMAVSFAKRDTAG